MINVTATTVTFHDSQANSHKFYRTYVCGSIVVFQWGRVGAIGQWNAENRGTEAAARWAATGKIAEKEAKGYTNRTEKTFDYNDSVRPLDPDDKDSLKRLDALHDAASSGPTPPAPTPTPTPAPAAPTPTPQGPDTDLHGAFSARALAAVGLAVSDPDAARIEFALLKEEWATLQQIHDKAASYLQTLENMVMTPVAVA